MTAGLRLGTVAAFLLMIAAAGCGDFAEPTIVSVGNDRLSLRDLRRALAELGPAERPHLDTREQRLAFVQSVIARRLLEELGDEVQGRDPHLLRDIEEERRRILSLRLRTVVGGTETPGEERIREIYRDLARRVWVHRMHFADVASARRAREEVLRGRDFLNAGRANGGTVVAEGWLGWSPSADFVGDAALRLRPGEISETVQAGPGADLLMVREEEAVAVPPLEEVRSRIIRGLRVRKQAERVRDLTERLREEANIVYHEETLRLLVEATRRAIVEGQELTSEMNWAVPDLGADDEGRILAEWADGGRWTAGEYRDAIRRLVAGQRPRLNLAAAVRSAAEAGVTDRLMHEEALRRNLDKDWWVERAVKRARSTRLRAAAAEHLDERRSPESAEVDSLTALLLNAQPQLFQRSARARVIWMECPTREAAEWERGQIARVGAWPHLLAAIEGTAPFSGSYRLTSLTEGGIEVPEIGDAVFGSGPGALTGPHEIRGSWVLVYCMSVEPARVLTREEALEEVWARTRAADDFKTIAQWVERRKTELGFNLDEDALDALAPGA